MKNLFSATDKHGFPQMVFQTGHGIDGKIVILKNLTKVVLMKNLFPATDKHGFPQMVFQTGSQDYLEQRRWKKFNG